MTTDLSKYLDMYISSTKDDLEALSQKLLTLENNPEDSELINECFRLAHTLKGNAATMMFENSAKLAHAMENLLDEVRSKRLYADPSIMDIFFQCVDVLEMMLEKIKNKKPEPNSSDLVKIIEEKVKSVADKSEDLQDEEEKVDEKIVDKEKKRGKRKKAKPEKEETVKPIRIDVTLSPKCKMMAARAFIAIRRVEEAGKIIELSPSRDMIESEKFDREFSVLIEAREKPDKLIKDLKAIKEIENVSYETQESVVESKPKRIEGAIEEKGLREIGSVRVKMDRLDDLLDSVGELVISKIRLAEISSGIDSKLLEDSVQSLDRLSAELQYNILRIRMVPIDLIFSKFPRMIRDLSRQMKKEIELIIEGNDIELDRSVIDKLGDILVHLVRNSIDHGIEPPKEREKSGKPKHGTIRLSASQEQNRVVIVVEDDGRGIDIDRIRKIAVQRGMYGKDELNSMSDDELLSILATPGFSTSMEVTSVSGRGVGLDAVKSGIETFGGHMEIETTKGKGTRIIIRLPLTLAIILAMMVRIENEIYAIPTDPIIESISIDPADVRTIGGGRVIKFRGEIMPLVYISSLLEISKEDTGSRAIIVSIGQLKAALVIDELLGQREIVVKPLDKYLRKIPFFGGATILGSGEVSLILDIPGLLNYAREQLKLVRTETMPTPGGGMADA